METLTESEMRAEKGPAASSQPEPARSEEHVGDPAQAAAPAPPTDTAFSEEAVVLPEIALASAADVLATPTPEAPESKDEDIVQPE